MNPSGTSFSIQKIRARFPPFFHTRGYPILAFAALLFPLTAGAVSHFKRGEVAVFERSGNICFRVDSYSNRWPFPKTDVDDGNVVLRAIGAIELDNLSHRWEVNGYGSQAALTLKKKDFLCYGDHVPGYITQGTPLPLAAGTYKVSMDATDTANNNNKVLFDSKFCLSNVKTGLRLTPCDPTPEPSSKPRWKLFFDK